MVQKRRSPWRNAGAAKLSPTWSLCKGSEMVIGKAVCVLRAAQEFGVRVSDLGIVVR